jgi:hypothetical protein
MDYHCGLRINNEYGVRDSDFGLRITASAE